MHEFIKIVKNKTILRKVIARPISIQFKSEFSVCINSHQNRLYKNGAR